MTPPLTSRPGSQRHLSTKTPAAGSLIAPVLPGSEHDTDPPPRASKARELLLDARQHAALPDVAFDVMEAIVDELDEVHEETTHTSQRQTALELSVSGVLGEVQGKMTDSANMLVDGASKLRKQVSEMEELRAQLVVDLAGLRKADSRHDLSAEAAEAKLIEQRKLLDAERVAREALEKLEMETRQRAEAAEAREKILVAEVDDLKTDNRIIKKKFITPKTGIALVGGILSGIALTFLELAPYLSRWVASRPH